MAEANSYKFDGPSVRRIDRALRRTFAAPDSTGGGPGGFSRQDETCWGRLTAKVTGGWEWEEVLHRDATGIAGDITWEIISGGREGDDAEAAPNKLLAVEIEGAVGALNRVVLLRRVNTQLPGASEGDPPTWRREWAIVGNEPTLVKITGAATGGGKYTGVLWRGPGSDVPTTGNLSEAELGVTGDEVLILNTREVGAATHDLASSGFLPLIFPATYLRTNSDGKRVYAIDGRQSEDC